MGCLCGRSWLSIDHTPFLHSLIKNQLGVKFKNGSIQLESFVIDTNLEAHNPRGVENLFILGLPTEDIKFHTFILPRAHAYSTFLCDSNRAVNTFLKGF